MAMMTRVMWQPPPHQFLTSSDHPTGHGCEGCTATYEPQWANRRLTRRWAQRRAEFLNLWSMRPGHFYVEEGRKR